MLKFILLIGVLDSSYIDENWKMGISEKQNDKIYNADKNKESEMNFEWPKSSKEDIATEQITDLNNNAEEVLQMYFPDILNNEGLHSSNNTTADSFFEIGNFMEDFDEIEMLLCSHGPDKGDLKRPCNNGLKFVNKNKQESRTVKENLEANWESNIDAKEILQKYFPELLKDEVAENPSIWADSCLPNISNFGESSTNTVNINNPSKSVKLDNIRCNYKIMFSDMQIKSLKNLFKGDLRNLNFLKFRNGTFLLDEIYQPINYDENDVACSIQVRNTEELLASIIMNKLTCVPKGDILIQLFKELRDEIKKTFNLDLILRLKKDLPRFLWFYRLFEYYKISLYFKFLEFLMHKASFKRKTYYNDFRKINKYLFESVGYEYERTDYYTHEKVFFILERVSEHNF